MGKAFATCDSMYLPTTGDILLLLLLLLWHPARAGGRNCQAPSSWAGRKRAVGRRHAGRACADNDRGGRGGGCAFCLGGGGRCCERDHLSVSPWFPPPPLGEGVRTCAKRRRDWGRDAGTTCPGTRGAPFPLASSRHSPATGEGATSCAEVE